MIPKKGLVRISEKLAIQLIDLATNGHLIEAHNLKPTSYHHLIPWPMSFSKTFHIEEPGASGHPIYVISLSKISIETIDAHVILFLT